MRLSKKNAFFAKKINIFCHPFSELRTGFEVKPKDLSLAKNNRIAAEILRFAQNDKLRYVLVKAVLIAMSRSKLLSLKIFYLAVKRPVFWSILRFSGLSVRIVAGLYHPACRWIQGRSGRPAGRPGLSCRL